MSTEGHTPPPMDPESPPSKRRAYRSTSASSDFSSLDVSSPSLSPFSHDSDGWSTVLSPERGAGSMPDLPAVPTLEPGDRLGFGKPAGRSEPYTSAIGSKGLLSGMAQVVSPSSGPGDTGQAAHILRLQSQLANVSDYLSQLVPNNNRQSPSLAFKPAVLRKHMSPSPQLESSATIPGKTRELELEQENEKLRRALRLQTNILARQRKQTEDARAFEPPPMTVSHGIDPQTISELANDLICGLKTVDTVTSTLLDLVERAGGTTVEKEREKLHPIVRLNNAEGVLDITMDRVTALEKDTRSLKRSADWEVYQRS